MNQGFSHAYSAKGQRALRVFASDVEDARGRSCLAWVAGGLASVQAGFYLACMLVQSFASRIEPAAPWQAWQEFGASCLYQTMQQAKLIRQAPVGW